MSHATSNNSISCLRSLFSQFGIPRQIVSDNGSQFTSSEFKQFCLENGIKLVLTTPYHSRSNGLVERAIRTFKWRFSKSVPSVTDRSFYLQQLLFVYRTTEHSTTGRTPAELFLGRRINTVFDLLKPSARNNIDQRQFMTKHGKDRHTSNREFDPGDTIYLCRPVDRTWATAVVSQRTSPLSYTTTTGQRIHADHMKECPIRPASPVVQTDDLVVPQQPSNSTSAAFDQYTPILRRSSRPNLGVPPLRYRDEFL